MPQLSIYMNDAVAALAKQQARRRNTSLSNYLSKLIVSNEVTTWPDNFFDLIGSLSESDLAQPEELSWELDRPRIEH